jgi:hypothetical protein
MLNPVSFDSIKIKLNTGDYRTSVRSMIITPYKEELSEYADMSNAAYALVVAPVDDDNLTVGKTYTRKVETCLYRQKHENVWEKVAPARPINLSLTEGPGGASISQDGTLTISYVPPYGKTSITVLAEYTTDANVIITGTTKLGVLINSPPVINTLFAADESIINTGNTANVLLYHGKIYDADHFDDAQQKLYIDAVAPSTFCDVTITKNETDKYYEVKVTARILKNAKFSITVIANDGFTLASFSRNIAITPPSFIYKSYAVAKNNFNFVAGSPKLYDLDATIMIRGTLNCPLTPEVVNALRSDMNHMLQGTKKNYSNDRSFDLAFMPSDVIQSGNDVILIYNLWDRSEFYQHGAGGNDTKFLIRYNGNTVLSCTHRPKWFDVRLKH